MMRTIRIMMIAMTTTSNRGNGVSNSDHPLKKNKQIRYFKSSWRRTPVAPIEAKRISGSKFFPKKSTAHPIKHARKNITKNDYYDYNFSTINKSPIPVTPSFPQTVSIDQQKKTHTPHLMRWNPHFAERKSIHARRIAGGCGCGVVSFRVPIFPCFLLLFLEKLPLPRIEKLTEIYLNPTNEDF